MSIPTIQAIAKVIKKLKSEDSLDLLYQYGVFRSGTKEQKLDAAEAIGAYMLQYISQNTIIFNGE